MKRVLFICTHNSARSQMAEALANHDLAGRVKAFSAGTTPSSVHPMAVRMMAEIGIDISGAGSKGLEEFVGQRSITLSRSAVKRMKVVRFFSAEPKKFIWVFPIRQRLAAVKKIGSPPSGR